jgi:hypothetical protein
MNRFQKRNELYSDILTLGILRDVCWRVTGCRDYTYDFVDAVNVGRLATIEYGGTITYVSFSETGDVAGRNSSFQSLPSAVVRYYRDTHVNKRICFYFLQASGNVETSYFRFMYRLMATAGVEFINADAVLTQRICPFSTVEDIIAARDANRLRNRSNNSTYVTISTNHVTQIYGKTYGASKKETALLCIALSRITPRQIELYEICEGNLTELPELDREVIQSLGRVTVIPTDLTMELHEFETDNSLRSPRFTYNLLERFGPKRCALCGCSIPELVQGAHIWPVVAIKRESRYSIQEKIQCATDGNNGIWLCENHHKMLDEDFLKIGLSGVVECKPDLEVTSREYIVNTTPITQLSSVILTEGFVGYLRRRYQ